MKKLFVSACLLATVGAQAAPVADTSTVAGPVPTARRWYRPTHLLLQTGGGLGMVAGGAGYEFANKRLEADVLIGYVPQRYAGSALGVASLKFLYSPCRLRVSERVQVLPLTAGAYVSYTHGVVNDGEKGQYPKEYYWFSADTRLGLMLGSRVTFLAPPVAATGQPRKLSAYYELGTNDLYLASYFNNLQGGLGFHELLTLALGIKVDF